MKFAHLSASVSLAALSLFAAAAGCTVPLDAPAGGDEAVGTAEEAVITNACPAGSTCAAYLISGFVPSRINCTISYEWLEVGSSTWTALPFGTVYTPKGLSGLRVKATRTNPLSSCVVGFFDPVIRRTDSGHAMTVKAQWYEANVSSCAAAANGVSVGVENTSTKVNMSVKTGVVGTGSNASYNCKNAAKLAGISNMWGAVASSAAPVYITISGLDKIAGFVRPTQKSKAYGECGSDADCTAPAVCNTDTGFCEQAWQLNEAWYSVDPDTACGGCANNDPTIGSCALGAPVYTSVGIRNCYDFDNSSFPGSWYTAGEIWAPECDTTRGPVYCHAIDRQPCGGDRDESLHACP